MHYIQTCNQGFTHVFLTRYCHRAPSVRVPVAHRRKRCHMMLYGHYMGRHCCISLLPLMLSLHLYIFPVPTTHGALAVASHVVAAVSSSRCRCSNSNSCWAALFACCLSRCSCICPTLPDSVHPVELISVKQGVKLIFTEGHISIVVALKGPDVPVKTV